LAVVVLWSWVVPFWASFTVTNGVNNIGGQVANIGGAVLAIDCWMSVDIAKFASTIIFFELSSLAIVRDALVLIWTNISEIWASLASSINENDFIISR